MTVAQLSKVEELLGKLQSLSLLVVVHGDCLGADANFDEICARLKIPRTIRPCTFENMRAHCEKYGARLVAPPKKPMQRNRDIVSEADKLIGCPWNDVPIKKGSGTWATIRFAKQKGIPVHIIGPDGREL
jgi:hypothetical protein